MQGLTFMAVSFSVMEIVQDRAAGSMSWGGYQEAHYEAPSAKTACLRRFGERRQRPGALQQFASSSKYVRVYGCIDEIRPA
jgi:hypothetical protein